MQQGSAGAHGASEWQLLRVGAVTCPCLSMDSEQQQHLWGACLDMHPSASGAASHINDQPECDHHPTTPVSTCVITAIRATAVACILPSTAHIMLWGCSLLTVCLCCLQADPAHEQPVLHLVLVSEQGQHGKRAQKM